jgi:hypothetical protein
MHSTRRPTGRSGQSEPPASDRREGARTKVAPPPPLARLRAVALPLVAHLRADHPSRETRAAASHFLAAEVFRQLPELPRAAEVAANAKAVEGFWDGLLTARAVLGTPPGEANLAAHLVARGLLVAGLGARQAKAATTTPKREPPPNARARPATRDEKLRFVVELVRPHLRPRPGQGDKGFGSREAAALCEDLKRAFPNDFRNVTLDQCRDAIRRWSPGESTGERLSANGVAARLIASASRFKITKTALARLKRDIDRAVARSRAPSPRGADPAG